MSTLSRLQDEYVDVLIRQDRAKRQAEVATGIHLTSLKSQIHGADVRLQELEQKIIEEAAR